MNSTIFAATASSNGGSIEMRTSSQRRGYALHGLNHLLECSATKPLRNYLELLFFYDLQFRSCGVVRLLGIHEVSPLPHFRLLGIHEVSPLPHFRLLGIHEVSPLPHFRLLGIHEVSPLPHFRLLGIHEPILHGERGGRNVLFVSFFCDKSLQKKYFYFESS